MLKKFILLIFSLFIINLYSQDKRVIDSLRIEFKKKPNDFYLQKKILDQYIINADADGMKKEIEKAKINFKKNTDYFNYFRICDIYVLLLQQKYEETKKRLNYYEKNLDYSQLPITKALMHYFRGKIAFIEGDNKLANEFFSKSCKVIEEKKFDKEYYINNYINLANSYIKLGEYENALKILFQVVNLKNQTRKDSIYTSIGICYYYLRQLDKAEQYYKLSVKAANSIYKPNSIANLAILYLEREKYKEAEQTLSNVDYKSFNSTDSSAIFNVLGEIQKHKKNYKKAIDFKNIVIAIDSRENRYVDLANDFLSVGIMYNELSNYKLADEYFRKSYQLLTLYDDENAKLMLLENYVELEFNKNKNKAGIEYFREFLNLSDSISSSAIQSNTNELHLKFRSAEKEAQIKSQQLELQKEKTNKYLSFGGTAFLLLLSSGGYFWFRNKDKQKKLETQNALLSLQFDLNKMELQSLNKQLDPHEIKNLLASISPEIQEKAPESYRKMLKLLNITKASLNNSSMTESVKNQVQQIDDFLSLEKNSLSIPFQYSIENNIETKNAQIPRLMLKNLAENAIKHGIKRSENGGEVNIILTEEGQFFKIIVDDTGKGRKLDTISDTGIGTSTYRNLFATLNKKNTEAATFEIIDKKQGTKVVVKIPTNYKYD